MISKLSYDALKKYRDKEIPVDSRGLSEREKFLRDQGYIVVASEKTIRCGGVITSIVPSSYRITPLGEDALSTYEDQKAAETEQRSENRADRKIQIVSAALGAALGAIATLIIEHATDIVQIASKLLSKIFAE